jgi:hypothetical protein
MRTDFRTTLLQEVYNSHLTWGGVSPTVLRREMKKPKDKRSPKSQKRRRKETEERKEV